MIGMDNIYQTQIIGNLAINLKGEKHWQIGQINFILQ